MRSSREISSSMGFSTIEEPPPLSRITSAEAGCASSTRSTALAAWIDSAFGVGCPPRKYRNPRT